MGERLRSLTRGIYERLSRQPRRDWGVRTRGESTPGPPRWTSGGPQGEQLPHRHRPWRTPTNPCLLPSPYALSPPLSHRVFKAFLPTTGLQTNHCAQVLLDSHSSTTAITLPTFHSGLPPQPPRGQQGSQVINHQALDDIFRLSRPVDNKQAWQQFSSPSPATSSMMPPKSRRLPVTIPCHTRHTSHPLIVLRHTLPSPPPPLVPPLALQSKARGGHPIHRFRHRFS